MRCALALSAIGFLQACAGPQVALPAGATEPGATESGATAPDATDPGGTAAGGDRLQARDASASADSALLGTADAQTAPEPAANPAAEASGRRDELAPVADAAREAEWRRLEAGARADKQWAVVALREEIATGSRAADAARILVDVWATPRAERYADALAVVEAALARGDEPSLAAVRAELLRDIGQFDEARAALDGLARAHPDSLTADQWLSLAELWGYAAEPQRAQAVLDQADALLRGDARWMSLSRARAELGQELREGRLGVLERDLFGVLRGDEDALQRLRALQVLIGQGRESMLAAVALALDDRDPDVRSIAIRSLPDGAPGREDVVRVALLDPEVEVRLAGAAAAHKLDRSVRRELLTPALSRESDPLVQVALRDALAASDADR